MQQAQKFSRLFLTLWVRDTHVEVLEGAWPLRSRRTIPYRSIANVSVARITKRLEIHTNDGKTLRLAFGSERKAQRALEAILSHL